MSDQPFSRILENLPRKARAVKAKRYGELISLGWSSVAARTEAERYTVKYYRDLLDRFEKDFPAEAPFARKIAKRHVKGL